MTWRRLPWTVVGIVIVVVLFAASVWHRRWMSDDGLIVTRTVREILAGNGPVYSAFERAETDTSTIWTWLIVLVTWVTHADPITVALIAGGLAAVASVALAMTVSARTWRERGERGVLLPAGILVVVAPFPFADYATSGLENGLCHLWLVGVWWALVVLRPETSRRKQLAFAFLIGLGPLVRPDFALASAIAFAAMWLIARPAWPRVFTWLATALALPFAYEIFRAGYYGTLVPLPALAKSASDAEWHRGLDYLIDFARPYAIAVPIAVLVAVLATSLARRTLIGRDRIVVLAPIVIGAAMALFVVRVGGDFMHARMFLAPTLAVILPGAMLPARRWLAAGIAAIAVWALVVELATDTWHSKASAWAVEDEHLGYARWTKQKHPVGADAFRDGEGSDLVNDVEKISRTNERILISEGGIRVPMNPAVPGPIAFAVGRLGVGGLLAPLDGVVADGMGLANPIGARITITQKGIPGHEKGLPQAWLIADFGAPELADAPVAAARHAMSCGAIAELIASVREPLTASRFWRNLVGARRRTQLVIPSDPFDAEAAFCGVRPNTWAVSSAASMVADAALLDHDPFTVWATPPASEDHAEWIQIDFRYPREFSHVALGALATGFPVDFEIQVWDGTKWIDRVTETAFAAPATPTVELSWQPPDTTTQLRIEVTKLRALPSGGFGVQLTGVEVR